MFFLCKLLFTYLAFLVIIFLFFDFPFLDILQWIILMFYRLIASVLFFVFFLEIFLVQYLPNLSESIIISSSQKITQDPISHTSSLPHDRRKTAPEIRKYAAQIFKYLLSPDYNITLLGNLFTLSVNTTPYHSYLKKQSRGLIWDRRIDIKKTSVKLLYTPYHMC